MTCNDRGFFIYFPKCDKIKDLQTNCPMATLQMEHGVGLPDAHIRHMFRGVLPENVTEELKKLHATVHFSTWNVSTIMFVRSFVD